MTTIHKPFIMGMLMAVMMLWMLHGQLTANALSGAALATFVGVHILMLVVVIGGSLFAARLSPRLRRLIDRLHRPSLQHVGWMLVGALTAAGSVHLTIHGVT
jgi:hypothetical protein